jgi:hypothetical protein
LTNNRPLSYSLFMTTTNTTADLIAAQNKLSDLKKKARELKSDVKRYTKDLQQAQKNVYGWPADMVERVSRYSQAEIEKREPRIVALDEQIAALEAERPVVLPFQDVLAYFQGAALDNARDALELIALCQQVNYWLPGASRRCRAGLNPDKASKKLVAGNRESFQARMDEITSLMDRWDGTRPGVTFTHLGVSPTVTATLQGLEAVKVTVCPMEYKQVEEVNPETGKVVYKTIVRLLWPEGTVHGASRYHATNNNFQCQACGHAIKNAFNWVPLILWDTANKPKSLWVGRDCARNLFNIEMTGDLEIEGR